MTMRQVVLHSPLEVNAHHVPVLTEYFWHMHDPIVNVYVNSLVEPLSNPRNVFVFNVVDARFLRSRQQSKGKLGHVEAANETLWKNQAGIFPVARAGSRTPEELPCLRTGVLGARSLRGRWRGVHSLAGWRNRSSLRH